MNIGIDIDDTITNSSEVFLKYAKIYNKDNNIIHKIDSNELDQKKAFGWSIKDQKDFSSKYLKLILNEAKPHVDVIDSLNYLKSCGYKIFLITARNDNEVTNMYDFTKKWLKDNNIPFDKLIVNCSDKLQECLNNNVVLFIDDNYDTCKKIYNSKIDKVFLYETKYNKMYYDKLLIRVKNWDEIIQKVKEIKMEKELEYIDVDNREDFPVEPEGMRFVHFYGGTKNYKGYLVPEDLSRADFMERYPEYIPEQNIPIYENNGIILRADPKFPCPGFYILSLSKTYRAFDLIDDVTFLRFSYILKKAKEGMRKALNLNYAHLLSNEKSDPYVNVHFWLLPIDGTTSPDLLDFDVKEYLNSFVPKDELEKIISYNNKLRNYFKEIDLVSLDNEFTKLLEKSNQFNNI